MSDFPMPISQWAATNQYPTRGVLYNWTRPGEMRDELMRAGVLCRVQGRWLFNPARWKAYCEAQSDPVALSA